MFWFWLVLVLVLVGEIDLVGFWLGFGFGFPVFLQSLLFAVWFGWGSQSDQASKVWNRLPKERFGLLGIGGFLWGVVGSLGFLEWYCMFRRYF